MNSAVIATNTYDSRSFRFYSFTQTEEEVSLIIDQASLNAFPKGNNDNDDIYNYDELLYQPTLNWSTFSLRPEKLELVLQEIWIPIRRGKKSGFSM